jgi:hypothetical protein
MRGNRGPWDLGQTRPAGSGQSMSQGNSDVVSRKSHARSRVTNGGDLLPDVDGRSIIARRYRDIMSAILVDQGGEDHCSESRVQLVRRFAAAAVLAEQMESRLANGEKIDVAEFALLVSTLVRVANRIGLDRIPKNIAPTLDQYLATRRNTLETAG